MEDVIWIKAIVYVAVSEEVMHPSALVREALPAAFTALLEEPDIQSCVADPREVHFVAKVPSGVLRAAKLAAKAAPTTGGQHDEAQAHELRPKVVHVKHAPYDVYIGRRVRGLAGSPWGNPFRVGQDGDGPTVMARYREHVLANPDLVAALPQLLGKTLGCWCKAPATPDAPCHGDVLAELAMQQLERSKNGTATRLVERNVE